MGKREVHSVRISERGVVQNVEEFRPELNIPLLTKEVSLGVFVKGKIPVLQTGTPQ